MLAAIQQYWFNFLMGLLSTGLIVFSKYMWNLYQKEKKHQNENSSQELREELKKMVIEITEEHRHQDQLLQDQIDIVKSGVLSIQGQHFMRKCRELLKEEHEITLDEFEAVQKDHTTYNSLGGNHNGDIIFEMVVEKAMNNLAD